MVSAPARREQVRYMVGKGLSERRALAIVRMSERSATRHGLIATSSCASTSRRWRSGTGATALG